MSRFKLFSDNGSNVSIRMMLTFMITIFYKDVTRNRFEVNSRVDVVTKNDSN